jgi:hypothetical protein
MGEQSLADAGVTIGEIADSADGVTRFAILDMALVDPFHPDRVAVEVADNAPNTISGLIDHCAVIDFVHNSQFSNFAQPRYLSSSTVYNPSLERT